MCRNKYVFRDTAIYRLRMTNDHGRFCFWSNSIGPAESGRETNKHDKRHWHWSLGFDAGPSTCLIQVGNTCTCFGYVDQIEQLINSSWNVSKFLSESDLD